MRQTWLEKTERILSILRKRRSHLAEELWIATDIRVLRHGTRVGITQVLADELMEHGFGADGEFNAYGKAIDDLIGACQTHREDGAGGSGSSREKESR